jgi:hypothetical protein
VVSILILGAIAPAPAADITAYTQERIERSQLAQTIHTTFLFIRVLELVITGVLAYQWRKSDIPNPPSADDQEESQKETSSTLVWFSAFAGIIAFVTSYVAALLDVFVFDVYGGLNSNTLICLDIPAGLFGALGGIIWHKVRRKSKFTPIDLVPLTLIGFLAGRIPNAFIQLLGQ